MSYKTREDIAFARNVLSPPGDTLFDYLEHHKMTQAELARRMDRPMKTVNEIVKGKAAITPETALQLQHIVGLKAEFWLELERLHQLQLAELVEAEQQLESKEWCKHFPIPAMKKLFGLECENNWISKVNSLLSFFKVSSVEAFNSFYDEQYLQNAAFRMSTSHEQKHYAVIAWLRQGEIQVESITTPPYDRKKFSTCLDGLKEVMKAQPVNFWELIQQKCLKAGVRVVSTPALPKAAINGSTRWIQDRPLIQLSNRYQRNDIFWFTFFHEAGHILLHGKKDVFIEGIEYSKEGEIKEEQADQFAAKFLLKKTANSKLLSLDSLNKETILALAEEYKTHPAAIIGRYAYLQQDSSVQKKLNAIGWKLGFFERVAI